MAWTFCTSGAAIRKAGSNVNSTIKASGAALADWSNQAEAVINSQTRYDWTTNYSGLKANFKEALARAVTSLIAMNMINYDMSGYTSRSETQTMLDVLNDQVTNTISFLKKKQNQEKMV